MKPKPALRRRFIFRLLDRLFIPIAILCGWFLYYAHTNISNAINDVTQGNSGSFVFGYWIVAVGGTFILVSGFFFDRGERFENIAEGAIDLFLR